MSQQENELERSLRLASNEAAHRPEFCRVLLESTVFIFGSTEGDGAANPKNGTLAAGSKLSIRHWTRQDDSQWIPFFASEEALNRAAREPSTYVALPARSLFEMTLGASLILNPGEPYSKEFVPEEVKSLLDHGSSQSSSRTRVVEQATEVLLGQPRVKPEGMMASLSLLLTKHREVEAAYLALMHDPSIDDKPHLVVAILADGDCEAAIREGGAVAADTAPGGELVDFLRIREGDGGLSQYFLGEVEPFYRRVMAGN